MELLFRQERNILDLSLASAVEQNPADTANALIKAIRQATELVEQRLRFRDILSALATEIEILVIAAKYFDVCETSWVRKHKIRKVIRCCLNNEYPPTSIEERFWRAGGMCAIISLVRATHMSDKVITRCSALSNNAIDRLAAIVAQLVPKEVEEQIAKKLFKKHQRSAGATSALGRHPERSAKNLTEQVLGNKASKINNELLPEELDFMKLLVVMDPNALHEGIFYRGIEPQRRVQSSGETEEFSLEAVGIDVRAMADTTTFEDVIASLQRSGYISLKPGPLASRSFSVSRDTRRQIREVTSDLDVYKYRAMRFISFVFPQDEDEILFRDHALSQLPQLQWVHHFYHYLEANMTVSPHHRHELASALISSSRIQDPSNPVWKRYAVYSAMNILGANPCEMSLAADNVYLSRWAHQRDVFLSGQKVDIVAAALVTDPRSNAQRGLSIRSKAQEFVQVGNNIAAWETLDQWCPFDLYPSPNTCRSKAESAVHQKVLFMRAKILRWQGDWTKAEQLLFSLQDELLTVTEIGCGVISHYVGVLCELGQLNVADLCLKGTMEAIERLSCMNTKRGKRLRRTKAELLLRQGFYSQAESIYQELEQQSSELSDEWRLHTLVGLSMVAHFQSKYIDAEHRWGLVFELLSKLKWDGFSRAVYLLAIADVKFQKGLVQEAEDALDDANKRFRKTGRQYWITTVGTYFLDFLKLSISTKSSKIVAIDDV